MLLDFCKSCQYCLETMYWTCCEERFCFDKKIATYRLEDEPHSNGYTNKAASVDSVVTLQPANNNHLPPHAITGRQINDLPIHADKLYEGASVDSVVTLQPANNNHLPPHAITGRQTNDLPIHADKLYEVFSKSLIFRDEHELKKGSIDSLDELETKSEPDYLSDHPKPNRTKVYFEDEVNSPVTDFEIMFKDELNYSYDMFQIEEEEESDKTSPDTEEGLVMNVSVRKQDVVKPSTVTIKNENKLTIHHPIYEYDPSKTVMSLPSTLSLPRVESVKGILRQKSDLPRSFSSKTLDRVDSGVRMVKPQLNRVESLKNMDREKINKVLARVPHRSASFLNIPEHLLPAKPKLTKSKSTIGVSLTDEEDHQLSRLPDTPIIKSNNLPRFFAESPSIPEYKGEVSLQSIKQQAEMMMQEDYSMPRYYGTLKAIDPEPVHESKSMPDLRNPVSTGKVSKRLVKIRSKLKPLVIKKGTEERL